MTETCDAVSFSTAWSETMSNNSNPYQTVAIIFASVVFGTFFISTITNNYSQVDKIWSITPFVFAWVAVVDARTLLMAIVATVWGVRLTFNFARRGGYTWPPWEGEEDYRWEIIRKGHFLAILKEPIPWMIFNFGFVSFYQNFLLLLISSPSLVAYTVAQECPESFQELNAMDYLSAVLFLTFVVIESIADNQQYNFQTEKYRRKAQGEALTGDFADGFCQSGLFSIVRKPNYAAEQAIWVCYYLFSVAATKRAWNWSAIGFLLLLQLFQSSGWFTEKITRQKYQKYNDYTKRVPLYLPNPFTTHSQDVKKHS